MTKSKDLNEWYSRVDYIMANVEDWGIPQIPDSEVEVVKDILKVLNELGVERPGIFPLVNDSGFSLEWMDPSKHQVDAEIHSGGVELTRVIFDSEDSSDFFEQYRKWDSEGVASRIQQMLYSSGT